MFGMIVLKISVDLLFAHRAIFDAVNVFARYLSVLSS